MPIPRQTAATPDVANPSSEPPGWLRSDWFFALLLFLATAAVVLWQNSRLGVLWDLSYILENSWRISLGDIPYRDFPFPYAPLTFLAQAAIIKIGGRNYFHHVLYAASMGGFATVLTWRILLNIMHDRVTSPRLVALMLTAPLIVLGVYSIFPHPFYDPDCTFAILACIFLLQSLEFRGYPPLRAFFTGSALVVPLFVKQNAGLVFLAATLAGMAVLVGVEWRNRHSAPRPPSPHVQGRLLIFVGTIAALLSALALIHLTAGLANYFHWTIRFAASRRLPPLADMLGVYRNPALLLGLASFLAGTALLRARFHPASQSLAEGQITHRKQLNLRRHRSLFSLAFMSAPFVWPCLYLLLDEDASERAERLLGLWPFLLIAALVLAVLSLRRSSGMAMVLPFILIATVHGAFLSQQLWGSTYSLWPLWLILFSMLLATLGDHTPRGSIADVTVPLSVVVSISLLVSGTNYVRSHERLSYANLSEGEVFRSTLPALAGLSVRGPWLPDFEELVRYANREIPYADGLLMIPGEDLFYYATGRRPRFPVLMFDHTVNPYSTEQILQISRARDIRWLVIKRKLQLESDPLEDRAHLLNLLRGDFRKVAILANYDVYRRN